jgi:hypothetical protein
MNLIRWIVSVQQRKADREIRRVLRRHARHEEFALEFERRMLGQ